MIKLPGLIDTHVHLREPGAAQKEDFETGTKAAIAGGFTQVLDMPNNPIATINPEALSSKKKLAEGRVYCDIGFHFGASESSVQYFPQVAEQVFGLKVYMNQTTGDLLMSDDQVLEKVFSSWPKEKVLMVHAEGETLEKAISCAKIGNRIGDISATIQQGVESAGYSIVKSLTGHGIGHELHEEPMVPGFGKVGTGPKIRQNMVLATEVIYTQGLGEVKLEKDNWTISSVDGSLAGLFEQTVLINGNGPIVLTPYL